MKFYFLLIIKTKIMFNYFIEEKRKKYIFFPKIFKIENNLFIKKIIKSKILKFLKH